MMDVRAISDDFEEAIRTAVRGELKMKFFSLPVIVEKDGDGHTVTVKSSVKGQVTTPDGKTKPQEYPQFLSIPIHFPGGGGVTSTHPVTKGDEGIIVFMSRPQDAWHQQGGVQMPVDMRMMSLSDGRYIPGGRSDPRKMQNVSTESAQTRSDDGRQTVDVHPKNGITNKSVDPSDTAKNPFKDAQTYHQSGTGPSGAAHKSVKDGKEHKSGTDHSGASMSADDGAHKVQALAGAGLKLLSNIAVAISCPPGGLSLPAGGVAGAALAAGAAATNVGALGGDIEGTLPNPRVISLKHVKDAHELPDRADDAAAAAAGVQVGHLYRTGSVLKVRIA